MKHVRVQVYPVGPADRACDRIDGRPTEGFIVHNCGEDPSYEHGPEVELPDEAIREGQAKPVATKMIDDDNAGWTGHGA